MSRLLRESAVRLPWTVRPVMTLLGRMAERSPEQVVGRMETSAGPADRDVFERPEVRTMLAESMVETFRSGARGAAYDLRLVMAGWGIPFGEIDVDVSVWHGEADEEVPVAQVRRLADALPRGRLHVVPGAGHHLALTHPDQLLEALVG